MRAESPISSKNLAFVGYELNLRSSSKETPATLSELVEDFVVGDCLSNHRSFLEGATGSASRGSCDSIAWPWILFCG